MSDAVSLIPYMLVSLVAAGMAMAFLSADRQSPTSRALALALLSIAASMSMASVMVYMYGTHDLPGWVAVPEAVAMVALLEWLLRIRRTVPAAGLNTEGGDRLLRIAQGVSVLYLALCLIFPEQRTNDFLNAGSRPGAWHTLGFWMFFGPILFVSVASAAASLLLLNRKPDEAERVRLIAMNCALPFLAVSLVTPWEYVPVVMVIGEMIFLVGAVRYHVLQGSRGQFLSRFLSPQVAEMVQSRGLAHAMRQNLVEITVVCCDLRGFTAYARLQGSARVIEVLQEYYDEVGKIVGEFGGTIKDFAGDGILILIGAPLAVDNHAKRGLEMARRIRDTGLKLTQRWSTPESPLGLGVGVASGMVTVGIIGSSQRLEYTAVGSAVNLASRLCEEAASAEIRVDDRTMELAGHARVASEPLALKGFGDAVPNYLLS